MERVLTFDEHTQHSLNDQSAASGPIESGPLLEAIAAGYALAAQAKGLRLSLLAPSGRPFGATAPACTARSTRLWTTPSDTAPNGQVTLAAMLQDGLARISITDEGPGIPHEERDRLFAAFFRGRSTRALAETPGAGWACRLRGTTLRRSAGASGWNRAIGAARRSASRSRPSRLSARPMATAICSSARSGHERQLIAAEGQKPHRASPDNQTLETDHAR